MLAALDEAAMSIASSGEDEEDMRTVVHNLIDAMLSAPRGRRSAGT
jgi:hypothetical protein